MEEGVRISTQEYGPGEPWGQGRRETYASGTVRGGPAGPALACILALGFLWGCAPPDRPGRLPDPLPPEVLEGREISSSRTLSPGPGLAYYGLTSPEGPWAIHLIRVDLKRCDLGLRILKAPKQEGMPGGLETVSEMEDVRSGKVLAAVNGDFFTPRGISVGTEVVGGVVSRIRDRPALAWHPGGLPWMGMPRPEGDSVLVLGWRMSRETPDGATLVVGGFPLLLAQGEPVGDLAVGALPSFAAARHPRTAVGVDEGRGYLWLVVVDGRQPGYSDGMTLPELTELLEDLGATDAVNLDGGGSTVMVLRGVRVSRPSDPEGERPVVNALAVDRNPSFCTRVPPDGPEIATPPR